MNMRTDYHPGPDLGLEPAAAGSRVTPAAPASPQSRVLRHFSNNPAGLAEASRQNRSLKWTVLALLGVLLLLPGLAQAQLEAKATNANRLDSRQAGAVVTVNASGVVTAISVRSKGAGYTTSPIVTIASPASGVQASASAQVSAGGSVTGFTVISGGSGYSQANPPVVTIAPPTALIPSGGLAVTTPQFAAAGPVGGSSVFRAIGGFPTNLTRTVFLNRSTIGSPFASGVPRYFMGDEITPPLVNSTGTPFASSQTNPVARAAELLAQARAYWRAEPVRPDERSTAIVNMPAGDVPPGSPLLPDNLAEAYHWSKHAEKTYANQPGRTQITWVTQLTESGKFRTKQETFAVSAATSGTVRTIFWTERTFDGPQVTIQDNRVTSIAPAYYNTVPKVVANEVALPGISQVENSDPGVILKTLWFERYGGSGSLRAYNVEGRILIEYLGNLRKGQDIFESLGTDIVEIVRVPTPTYVTVPVGEEIRPHTGETQLIPSPKLVSNPGKPYYGTTARLDGSQVFHAERETGSPNIPEDGAPSSSEAYGKVVFYWLEEGKFSMRWPVFQNRYWQRWPVGVEQYAHNTVPSTGSNADTAVQFTSGILPTIVFQDDAAEAEARLDIQTQRLLVGFTSAPDGLNRSLLKFSANGKVWYVRLYTQSASRAGYQEGNGDPSQMSAAATVGQRLSPPPDFSPPGGGQVVHYETAGYVASGTCYQPQAYISPIASGVAAAAAGAIIPVNTVPSNQLEVWWFRKMVPPSDDFEPFYIPSKIARYSVSFPATTTPQIVIAQGIGTGDLPPEVAAGSIYVQNTKTLTGYNPNEEHATMIGTRAYALRDDLNIITPQQSQPFVLISYINPLDQRPDMKTYKVVREVDLDGDRADPEDILFDRPVVAGTLLVAPYPLPLMPLPLKDNKCVNKEVTPASGRDQRASTAGFGDDVEGARWVGGDTPVAWDFFTMRDRTGLHWVYRGPHDGASTTKRIAMQYQYVSRAGFSDGNGTEIAPGTLLPFLRPLSGGVPQGDPLSGKPLTINFIPSWPTNAPELRVGETLALPKFGLPQVRGQKSAEVLYEQSKALATAKPSVTLLDPTREKTVQLIVNNLDKLPGSIATSDYLGKKYFQRLGPDLQERIWFDPLRAPDATKKAGTLVLIGEFKDEIAGEDYLHLNVLTTQQIADLKGLCTEGAPVKTNWDASIDAMRTRVETFAEDPAKRGAYKVESFVNAGEDEPARITNPDTAVDSYALTATGEGAGWVTMVFGNGKAFTPEGDPVQVKIFKVAPTLYTGELKALYSKNPLDEKVTLRHTGDFAARPQDYEFEWKWAPGTATAPATYTTSWSQRLGGPNNLWTVVRNPAGALPTPTEYTDATAAGAVLTFPRTIVIRDAAFKPAGETPGLVVKTTATTPLDFTSSGVPGEIVFSASLGELDGLVLYINGNAAVANQAPAAFSNTDAATGLVPGNGLGRQFRVPRSFFTAGLNKVEVALFTSADANASANLDFRLDVTQEQDVVASTFQSVSDPTGKNNNVATISGDPAQPFGGSTFVLNDRWYTMRYKPRTGVTSVAGTGYSRWMSPQFVEGWIKRVLRDINPFEQRVKDMFNNAISTDTSVLTQAGTKWEGDIALTLSNIESVGLIAIYETVLNRARSMSIDANTNDPDTNNALMLAAGYLSDLYTLLGHEAMSDAANPTISTDDTNEATEINTSRFSFENQVSSALDEELGLLRGRDASGTRIDVSPAYNRLYWNYTGGINAGEVLYATNYNVKEKAGSTTADGVIDAADAQRMYPQGHGDAYGHYLTALKGYYKLLSSPNFSWQRRAEAVLVLGQAVTVDFVDERKFAGDAASLADAAGQICALTYRQQYKDGEPGWAHYRDTATAPNSTEKRNWGLDEWSSRGAQGAYYHWVVANAMLPDVDTFNTGVEKIDRTTVPELNELATTLTTFQTTVDNASARLNPLGLSPGAIPFDIDPTFLEVGSTAAIGAKPVQGTGHFGQIFERALKSLQNAAGSFNQAARMTRLLRSQENQVDDYNTVIVDQERTYRNQLIELFGQPYEGEIGPGKAYPQGYFGPDLAHWFVVDRPNALVDTTVKDSKTLHIWQNIDDLDFTNKTIFDFQLFRWLPNTEKEVVEVTAYPNEFIQYSDVWQAGLGARKETGELQGALLDAHRAFLDVKDALYNVIILERRFAREGGLFVEALIAHQKHLTDQSATRDAIIITQTVQKTLEATGRNLEHVAENLDVVKDAVQEFFPKVVGVAADATSAPRGFVKVTAAIGIALAGAASVVANNAASFLDIAISGEEMALEGRLAAIGFGLEETAAGI